ncbi:MAG: iron ABC transporter permease [Pseudomonadales bacterium]
MNTSSANDVILEGAETPTVRKVSAAPGVFARVLNVKSLWPLFLLVLSLPTLLALGSVLASLFHLDAETLSHLVEYLLPAALANTLFLVFGVGLGSAVIGVALAWLTAVCDFPLRRFFSWALLLPMAIPGYVMAFAFVGLFEFSGPVQSQIRDWLGSSAWFPDVYSYGGVTLVMTLVLYPYVYLIARNAFQTQGRRSIEVGQSLGLSSTRSFFRVSLPMARPWIVGGVLLVVMETLADFGTVATFNYDTLTTLIYKSWFSLFSLPAALQVASVLLLAVVVIMLIERRSRAAQRYAQSQHASLSASRFVLTGKRRWVAVGFCTLVFAFAFVMPSLRLLTWAMPNVANDLNSYFFGYVWSTLSLATIAMLLIAVLALLLAYGARINQSLPTRFAVRTSTLGYALPGTVLAIGLFAPISFINHWLHGLGVPMSWLQGTFVIMLMAYGVRFMAVAYSPIENNYLRITPSVDDAAHSLGLSGLQVLRRVHLPIVQRGILTAMVLVFVDVMKELPITLMTRPFGFNTLAVRVFELSSEGLWQRAALPALAIMLVGLIPVVLLIRKTDQND